MDNTTNETRRGQVWRDATVFFAAEADRDAEFAWKFGIWARNALITGVNEDFAVLWARRAAHYGRRCLG